MWLQRAALGLSLLLCACGPATTAPRRPGPSGAPRILFQEQGRFGWVYVVEQDGRRILRFGAPDAEDQSIYRPGSPRHEPLQYIRTALLALAMAPLRGRLLMVGLGGGSFLRHARALRPGLSQEVVEIDPVVVRAARRFFGVTPRDDLRVHVADGRRFIQRTARRYELVFIDAYDDVDYPRHLGTREFFGEVRRRLAPSGVVVANLSPNRDQDRDDLVVTFRSVFSHVRCFYTPRAGNTVVVGGPGVASTPRARFLSRVRLLERRSGGRYRLREAAAQRCAFDLVAGRVRRDPPPRPRRLPSRR